MDISTQIEIEKQYSKKLISAELLEILQHLPNIEQVHARYMTYLNMNHSQEKLERLYAFNEHMKSKDINIKVVFSRILVTLHMTHGESILQSLCGQNSYLASEDKFDAVTTLGELVMLMNGLFYTTESRGTYILVKTLLTLPEELQAKIDNTAFVPPMIVKPKPYTNNFDGGYYEHKTHLMTGKNNHSLPQNLDFINTMNSLPMSLDKHIVNLPRVPTYNLDTPLKNKNYNKLVSSTKRVVNTVLSTGNKFYFVYRYDARGRSYASGYQINPMGDDYSKALINLNTEEILDESY